jgi:phosphate/sulfate permease
MLVSVGFGLFASAAAGFRSDNLWMVISPFAIAWILAPLIAHTMSLSPKLEDALSASPEDRESLRMCPTSAPIGQNA